MKRIAARISRPHGPTCETGDDTVGVGDPSRVPVSGLRRDQNGCQKCASSVWPAVRWIGRVRRNPAYAASSDRQAA